jgi:Niemann-Pick C1 protein
MGGNPPSPYDGEPFVINDQLYEQLGKHCKGITLGSPVCCNTTQVEKLLKNLMRIDITMWHCPSCMNNFKQMWCEFTCSPNQGDFVIVNELYPPPFQDFVAAVDFKIDPGWMDRFWNSCKDNVLGAAPLRKTYRNGEFMLQGLVDSDKPKPMVKFNFVDSPNPLPGLRFNGTLQPCEVGCMCTYCEGACHGGKQIQPDFTCKIGTMPCLMFGMIVLAVSSFLFLLAVVAGVVQRIVKWYSLIEIIPKSDPEKSALLH